MELKDIDLNLLVVFNQLYRQRRVSAAAVALGLTQPAVSNALARLRRLLGDELFLRTSRGMEPTPLASRLAEPIAHALAGIEATLNQQQTFKPEASNRNFTIGMTDVGEIYFLPTLMNVMAEIAPGVTVSTVRDTSLNLRDAMEAGQVDMAIGFLREMKEGYFQRQLFRQRYVCLFRAGHALDRGGMTLKEFTSAEHVVVVAAETGHSKVDELIERKGISRRIRLTVPHFVALGHILHNTDLIATVPERYAMHNVRPFSLTYVRHPVTLPEIAINIFWHPKFHKDPANQWLRSQIIDIFAES